MKGNNTMRKVLCIGLLFSLVCVFSGCIYKNSLLTTSHSPDKAYIVNAYISEDFARSGSFLIRCEAVNVKTDARRTIYLNTTDDTSVNISWEDDITVVIDGMQLNVLTDSYNYTTN